MIKREVILLDDDDDDDNYDADTSSTVNDNGKMSGNTLDFFPQDI